MAIRQETVGGHEFPPVSSVTLEKDKTKDDNSQLKESEVLETSKSEQFASKSGHVSQVRLLLSPKPVDHSSSVFTRDVSLPPKHFIPLRHSPSSPSSPDEGVGLSSPPEWQEIIRRRGGERYETSRGVIKQQRSAIHMASKPLRVDSTIVPHLLPYKPGGSKELFYVPQAEADSCNDMESTHSGSDDALPPRFSSDVLGHQDPGLERGVNIRHTEGIYSKRLSRADHSMSEQGRTVNSSSPIHTSQTPKLPSSSSPLLTRVPSPDADLLTAPRRDQGTSPVSFLRHELPPPPPKTQDKLYTEHHHHDDPPSTSKQNVSDLDQLWQRFSERWRGEEESRHMREREVSLLERLERLSRIIHTRDSTISETEISNQEVQPKSRKTGALRELKKQRHANKSHVSFHNQRSELVSRYEHSVDDLKLPGSADREVSLDSTSSMSTVDTERLVRAFGAERVQKNSNSSFSLNKLYSVISKQKEQETTIQSETSTNEESSVVVDSASSTCTYTLPPHRGPSKSLVSKKAVKLVSKGIQAGDLEIVSNGTRRHTRDVGTTFPSPGDVRSLKHGSPSSSLDREHKGHHKSHRSAPKHKKSPSKPYPHGISWFISADELKSESRKENEPGEWRPSAVWFEPLSRKPAWRERETEREREPLRPRQVEEQRNKPQPNETEAETATKKPPASSASRCDLQEALISGRPDFVSRSRQRLERLALLVEERRLQALLNQERDELFVQPGVPERLPRPAGTAQLRRAVPRKEMIQRSKQIYENLPEVRRRREEERRRAEYRSYRLNAQLYNKRITNHVLGRRSAWN